MAEIYAPSVDVCAHCTDSECDGIGCIARLDPDDPGDADAIDRLHCLIRAGRVFLAATEAIAEAEGR